MTAGALPGRPAGHRASHRGSGSRGTGRSAGGRRGTRPSRSGASAGSTAGRVLASVLTCALAVTAVKENYLLRGFEAGLASRVIAFVTSHPAGSIPQTPTFWFTIGPHHEMALQITAACTVVLMMTPFLVATAFLVWRRSSSTVRTVAACVVAIAMLLVVNQLRILIIIMFVLHLGYGGGFYWGHTLIGSLVTIMGGSATLIVYGLIAIRRGTPARTRQSAH